MRRHKCRGRSRDGRNDQQWRRRQDGGGIPRDQRGGSGAGERAGQDGDGQMGQGGRADQQRRDRGQLTVAGLHRRPDQPHGRRQPDVALLGEHTSRTTNQKRWFLFYQSFPGFAACAITIPNRALALDATNGRW